MSSVARATFDPARVHPAITGKLGSYQSELISRVEGLIQQHDVVIVGMAMNPFPGRARKLLDAQGIKYEYLGLGSYLSQWRVRLGLKMWTGWPTFPMIFVKRTFIGGFQDLKRLVDSGELAKLLAG
ncbi:MAG TPA: glutaredoxin domain-containing protein [Polyangiaceae bacterium]|nr:glutaredoxin domain-containing protein [Polyangiaceae bacterium]